MNAPDFTFDPDLIDELDPKFLDQMANDLAMTPSQARQVLRAGVSAGFLSVAVSGGRVIMRGEFPDEREAP